LTKLFKIKRVTIGYKVRQSDGSQVAHSDFIWRGVLDDFSAQITALDGSQVLLVRFMVAAVLVQHVWRSGFDLAFQDGIP
jgi:hypothetical protein